jgi:hypothetical protein
MLRNEANDGLGEMDVEVVANDMRRRASQAVVSCRPKKPDSYSRSDPNSRQIIVNRTIIFGSTP